MPKTLQTYFAGRIKTLIQSMVYDFRIQAGFNTFSLSNYEIFDTGFRRFELGNTMRQKDRFY
jgi:hypothetical protein